MNSVDATSEEINAAMHEAQRAFLSYKNTSGKRKAELLRAIADEIDALGHTLISTAMQETHLTEARIISERARTTGHCRMFADLVDEGSWLEARVDTALPGRAPAPKPDIRKMLVPIGPVVVFGAANFPLAYSTAGGDTASALAAGCPVIVKAHPAHAETSNLVARAIQKAIEKTGMQKGVFQHLHGKSFETGQALVKHQHTRAVGFTGSLAGGKALFDAANQRPDPIPVFAEMSSINPVILLPESLKVDFEKTAATLAASITLGVGQFCTNPGLIIAVENEGLNKLLSHLADAIKKTLPATMLHPGIADNYHKRMALALSQHGVSVEAQSSQAAAVNQGQSLVATVGASNFLKNTILAEEVFGPFSLVVKCSDIAELTAVVSHIHGQLTASIIASEKEITEHKNLLNTIIEKAGRLIINGVPTGVEVCPAMQHGGPYPATTDSRFTAVGTDAIKRFARPVAFQNFPDTLLPDELKESNPLKIWRYRNSVWEKN